jgi:hypothetical protein
MISKRGTKLLHQKHPELLHILIKKGCYGFYAININYAYQSGGTVKKTYPEVIADIEAGKLPKEMTEQF